MLAALGVRFLDDKGREITDLPVGLQKLHAIDRRGLDKRLRDCRLTVLCDVVNPLLGAHGAARIFGPQKGATPAMVEQLENILGRYAGVLHAETGIAIANMISGGVAGGASAGLKGVLDAELVNGRVDCDFPLAMVKSRGKRSLSGTIGDGRAELDLETVNGQIRVRRQ